MMLEAVRASFPIVDKLCEASDEEREKLLQVFESLPEKAIHRMVRDGQIRIDNETEVSENGLTAIIVGPESELLSRKGTMRLSIKGESFGKKRDDSLRIHCDVNPKAGNEYDVLHYITMRDDSITQYRHRYVYLKVSESGELSVRDEVTDDARLRGYSRSDYRTSYNESE